MAVKIVKLQVTGGKANPAPPVGTALGPHGVDIQAFCNQFNDRTKDKMGVLLPAIITIKEDRTFTFIVKQPPMSTLIMQKLGIQKASGEPNKTKVGKLTKKQVEEIAKEKMADLNTTDLEQAMRTVSGTARSMGIDVE
ncbi:MAG: 50S ribosomal protein L11 [Patescibacteria group bacterium]|nr:50S ribosomal protein L11 [Patescibacteria group bacterium]